MTVSKTASKIYKAAKLNNKKSVLAWKTEWAKAMRLAWRKLAQKVAWNIQETKRIAIATMRSAQLKLNIDRMAERLKAMTNEEREQANAKTIYSDYEKKWNSYSVKRS